MNTFLASLAEEEMAQAMDSPAQPTEDLGVTRLIDTCGHVFCRKELSPSYPSLFLLFMLLNTSPVTSVYYRGYVMG
jgi:hypothetical protein